MLHLQAAVDTGADQAITDRQHRRPKPLLVDPVGGQIVVLRGGIETREEPAGQVPVNVPESANGNLSGRQ